jgi:hypothetical protein
MREFMKRCQLCSAQRVKTLLDFGPQPICNRFPENPLEPEALFPMLLEQCQQCGLIQTTLPVPAHELRPRVDWITYNEPEGHLDSLADSLAQLPGVRSFGGVTFKDDSLLRRMRQRGFETPWRLCLETDLGVVEKGAGAETIQDKLTPDRARLIAEARGRVDVLLVRHIFEHAHQPLLFSAALRELVNPGGYVMLEIPDCEKALELCDYSTVWEEHVLYFTPHTFRQAFAQCGLSLVSYLNFPYTLENCLVGIARVEQGSSLLVDPALELERGLRFAAQFTAQREKFASLPRNLTMFGAGHLAATFINLLGIADHFDFVADDNPHKQGLFMPGSRLPIRGSDALPPGGLCFMSVAVESEEKVIARNRSFVESGGRFASIFPASKHALRP